VRTREEHKAFRGSWDTHNYSNHIKRKSLDCDVTSRQNIIIVLRPPLSTLRRQQNLVEQLEKSPVIQTLLNTSTIHREFFIQESRVLINIDPSKIQDLNEYLLVTQ